MSIETDADRAALLADFGVAVTYTKAGGAPVSITGIFDAPFIPLTFEGAAGADVRPALRVRAIDLPAGYGDGDAITVSGANYTLFQSQPDGRGFVALLLAKS